MKISIDIYLNIFSLIKTAVTTSTLNTLPRPLTYKNLSILKATVKVKDEKSIFTLLTISSSCFVLDLEF